MTFDIQAHTEKTHEAKNKLIEGQIALVELLDEAKKHGYHNEPLIKDMQELSESFISCLENYTQDAITSN